MTTTLHLVRWLLERATAHHSDSQMAAQAAFTAIKRVSKVSVRAAVALLDHFPEADTEGMQVCRPDRKALHELGTRDGNTHSRRRFGSIDDAIASGEWDSGPATHEIKFDFDEWVHVLEGEAHVTVQGQTRTIRAGDVALFRAGLSMTWVVPVYIRKLWVHRYPQPTLLERTTHVLKKLSAR